MGILSGNPLTLFNTNRWLVKGLIGLATDETIGRSGDRATATPALRRRPKTADELLQELRELLNGGQHQKAMKFLHQLYEWARGGKGVALQFYQCFRLALTKDAGLETKIRSHAPLRKLVEWQFEQLSDRSCLRNLQPMKGDAAMVTTVPSPGR